MNDISKPTDINEEIKTIFQMDIPHIYSNGFNVILGPGDVIIILKRMGNNVATLNLSYTLAKTMSEKLGSVIKHLENKTGNIIMTTDNIEKSLSKVNNNDTVK